MNFRIRSLPNQAYELIVAIRRINPYLGVFFLYFVTGLCIYINTLDAPFLFDDYHVIVNQDREALLRRLSNPRRVVAEFTFVANKVINGNTVQGYHIVNYLIHILTAYAIFLLMLQLASRSRVRNRWESDAQRLVASGLAGAVFLVHPLATQSVTYICQRYTSLATLFYVGCIAAYLKARHELTHRADINGWPERIWYIVAIVLAILAMLTKEFPVTLPASLVAIEFFFLRNDFKRRRQRVAALIPLALTGLIVPFLYRAPVATATADSPPPEAITTITAYIPNWAPEITGRAEYFLTQLDVVTSIYMKLMVMPVGQSFDHGYRIYDRIQDVPTSALAIISILLVLAIINLRRHPFLSVGILWFFIAIAPTSTIIPNKQFVAEHRVYLPLVSLSFLTMAFFGAASRRRFGIYVAMAALIALAVLTFHRNQVWRDALHVWQNAAAKSPEHDRPHFVVGNIHFRRSQFAEAATAYRRFLALNQNYSEGYNRLGLALLKMRQCDDAIEAFHHAINVNPDVISVYTNLAAAHVCREDYQAATRAYQMYLTYGPQDSAETCFKIADLAVKGEDYDLAETWYKQALSHNPRYVEAWSNLAMVFERTKRSTLATNMYRQALAFATPHQQVVIRLNLGRVYLETGNHDAAADAFGQVLAAVPGLPAAHIGLCRAYLEMGREDLAVAQYRKAIEAGAVDIPPGLHDRIQALDQR